METEGTVQRKNNHTSANLKYQTMTYFYYKTNTWNSQPQISEDQINLWKHLSEKKNWRIVQLPNGFYQTEYKDIECPCDPENDTCCE